VLLVLPGVNASAGAQSFNPLPEGWRFHVQTGVAFSTIVDVSPAEDTDEFGRSRGFPTNLRVSRIIAGPVVGFAEVGTARRGATVRSGGEDLELRNRYWDGSIGLSAVGRCLMSVCPSLDLGGSIGYLRESIVFDRATSRPEGTLNTKRYESTAIVGLRLASARFRGMALVLRHHEGLSDIPNDGSKARSRGQSIMLSLPVNP
jgi:hypothetical protein